MNDVVKRLSPEVRAKLIEVMRQRAAQVDDQIARLAGEREDLLTWLAANDQPVTS